MAEFKPILSDRYGLENSHTLPVAEKAGAYATARRALISIKPEQIQAEVKAANIRGRGGAGFPAGVKWGFLAKREGISPYLVINADEGEPGTFKDRTIMELDPHRLIEGCIITCYAIGAHTCYIYVRCELVKSIARLDAAIAEARAKGYLGGRPFGVNHAIEIYTHPGAGAYICGEETALLNSLEGKRGEPRLKPPFPAVAGAFGAPTIVNNVETIASVPDIVKMGGAAWAALSPLPNDGGSRLYGVSGHVKKPGVFEAPVGITLRQMIYDYCGGMLHDDRPLKGVIPGGSSTPVLRPDDLVHAPDEKHPLHAWHGKSHIDVPMGVDTMRALGTMLGTCCAIVMDSSVNMVDAARNLMRFYAHESCGQCTPCREGTGWLYDTLHLVCTGKGTVKDVELLVDISNNMMGNTICALADGTAMPMLAFVRKYRDEFLAVAKGGGVGGTRLDDSVRALIASGSGEGSVSSFGTIFFAIAAGIAVISAFGAIASRTPIRSAMCLLAHIISLAGLYLTLHAHLLAAVQLIVYAGAVVVLFVFVIMLIGPTEEPRVPGLTGATPRVLSIFLMASVALTVASAVGGNMPFAPEIKGCPPGVVECGEFGGVKGVASVLYKDAAVPFELVSVLLLVAVLGAIVVARGRSQQEQAKHKADRAARDAADAAQRDYEQKLSAEVSAHGGH